MKQSLEAVVAVIDDNASLRRSLANLLGSVGLTAEIHASAEEFLARAQFDAACAVVDLRLPAMSGLELAYELRERAPALPLIFLTAQNDAGTRQRCLDAGAAAFVTKPFVPDELVRIIRSVMTKP